MVASPQNLFFSNERSSLTPPAPSTRTHRIHPPHLAWLPNNQPHTVLSGHSSFIPWLPFPLGFWLDKENVCYQRYHFQISIHSLKFVYLITAWTIWSARNKFVMENIPFSPSEILDKTIFLSLRQSLLLLSPCQPPNLHPSSLTSTLAGSPPNGSLQIKH